MKKSILSLSALFFVLTSFTIAHKFYVSVTNINYSEKTDALQITSRIFIDDLEVLLKERYGIDAALGTEKETSMADDYIQKYLKAKFVLELNEEIASYNYIGKKYDNDVVIIYLEVPEIGFTALNSISIQNEVLTDLYEEQKNLVHIKWKGKKKSFVLIRENNKGMLNL
ncbi:hypothetical protein MTsPCn9_35350 [Croceitalea sp. MTPC9]|uniref:DUF6702 family protein n=1 Tax=unclassified Croceitalea TaxID=2632280 RepID=UPI002B3A7E71|nr:hypothetical protein MTsPCn6_17980 [Croceitalea sp. MTPC6]GMN18595.1 hypothetical protein MTsPCn9_35350 [Croceitalea sp. MTPC9]